MLILGNPSPPLSLVWKLNNYLRNAKPYKTEKQLVTPIVVELVLPCVLQFTTPFNLLHLINEKYNGWKAIIGLLGILDISTSKPPKICINSELLVQLLS